jgi:hypothetical protein
VGAARGGRGGGLCQLRIYKAVQSAVASSTTGPRGEETLAELAKADAVSKLPPSLLDKITAQTKLETESRMRRTLSRMRSVAMLSRDLKQAQQPAPLANLNPNSGRKAVDDRHNVASS